MKILIFLAIFPVISECFSNYRWNKKPGTYFDILGNSGICGDKPNSYPIWTSDRKQTKRNNQNYMGVQSVMPFQTMLNKRVKGEGGVLVTYKNIFVASSVSNRNQLSMKAAVVDQSSYNGFFRPEEWNQNLLLEKIPKNCDGQSTLGPGMFYLASYQFNCNEKSYNIQHPFIIDNNIMTVLTCEKELHPVFCTQGKYGDLIDVVSFHERSGDPFVIGYFGDTKVVNPRKYRRIYTAVSYKGYQFENATKVKGLLSGIDYYDYNNETFYGYYFTNDGNACHFTRPISSRELIVEDLSPTRAPCKSYTNFFGCPQPWCFDNQFDASFTTTIGSSQHLNYVYLVNQMFYWRVRSKNPPLDTPRESRAILSSDSIDTDLGKKTLSDDEDFFIKNIRRSPQAAAGIIHPTSRYLEHVLVSGVGNKHQHWTIYYPTDTYYYHEVVESILSGYPEPEKITLIWYNPLEQLLYVFHDSYYIWYFYTHREYPLYTSVTKPRPLSDFGFDGAKNFSDLMSVISIDNKAYFVTHDNWVYTVDARFYLSKAIRPKTLTLQTLFSVQKDCYLNDFEYYKQLLKRYGVSLDKNSSKQHVTGYLHDFAEKQSKIREIVLIISSGVVMVCAAWIIMFYRNCYESESSKQSPKKTSNNSSPSKRVNLPANKS